jgi:prepilin-type processing-associated H-X9-DG protein
VDDDGDERPRRRSRDDAEEDDGHDRARKKKGGKGLLIGLCAGGGVLLVGAAVLIMLLVLNRGSSESEWLIGHWQEVEGGGDIIEFTKDGKFIAPGFDGKPVNYRLLSATELQVDVPPEEREHLKKLREETGKSGPSDSFTMKVAITKDELTLHPPDFERRDKISKFRRVGATDVQAGARRGVSQNNLRQIGLGVLNHEAAYRGFPPPALTGVNDKEGRPLLSWRVAILPYIEQDALYRQFHLDEPWDSPHNKKLIAQMPKVYAAPGIQTKSPGLTHYQVLVGPGTAFEPMPGRSPANIRVAEITDGLSNTLMVVEAADPVIWTKPDDLRYDPKGALPKLGGLFGDGFNAAFCDGHVVFLRRTIAADTLRALMTRNGGDIPGNDRDD